MELRQQPTSVPSLSGARELSGRLPDLLVQARRIAATVILGQHGRRRAGPGETFWQFRPYSFGEPVKRIDWRRSARDPRSLMVREREWEAVQTAWLWSDLTASMLYSSGAAPAKAERALVLTLALADLLGRGGERIGVPGLMRPRPGRDVAEKAGEALIDAAASGAGEWPDAVEARGHDEMVVVSDFLRPTDALIDDLRRIAGRAVRLHLLQVLDEAEEEFPYDGRIEFRDPETGETWLTDRAGSLRDRYHERLRAHRAAIRAVCGRAGWTFSVHHTNRPASEALLVLVSALSGERGIAA